LKKRIYIETYGCQMNVADTEVVQSLLQEDGHEMTDSMEDADVLLINTCSVRENAEQRVYGRLGEYKRLKLQKPGIVVGLLGCMAERLRASLLGERARGVGKAVDLIIGPDEYRKTPALLRDAWNGDKGIAVRLSRVETYDDITPLRTDGVSAWISVMRGCDKFCSFCVVPLTRGRERSRSLSGVVKEVEALCARGFKEVTLLGQNVNSYRDGPFDFADLLEAVAGVDLSIRVRFTTSHPCDMSAKLIRTIAGRANICNYIHLPVQSGSDRILQLMNRTYDESHYLRLLESIRETIPDVCLSTDFISGFPTETEEDHRLTLALMERVQYDGAFIFKYSPRELTPAFRMSDDIPGEVKTRRIDELIRRQSEISEEKNRRLLGQRFAVLVEGPSKKSSSEWQGRTDGNKTVIFQGGGFSRGEYVVVSITRSNAATLFGEVVNPAQVLPIAISADIAA